MNFWSSKISIWEWAVHLDVKTNNVCKIEIKGKQQAMAPGWREDNYNVASVGEHSRLMWEQEQGMGREVFYLVAVQMAKSLENLYEGSEVTKPTESSKLLCLGHHIYMLYIYIY